MPGCHLSAWCPAPGRRPRAAAARAVRRHRAGRGQADGVAPAWLAGLSSPRFRSIHTKPPISTAIDGDAGEPAEPTPARRFASAAFFAASWAASRRPTWSPGPGARRPVLPHARSASTPCCEEVAGTRCRGKPAHTVPASLPTVPAADASDRPARQLRGLRGRLLRDDQEVGHDDVIATIGGRDRSRCRSNRLPQPVATVTTLAPVAPSRTAVMGPGPASAACRDEDLLDPVLVPTPPERPAPSVGEGAGAGVDPVPEVVVRAERRRRPGRPRRAGSQRVVGSSETTSSRAATRRSTSASSRSTTATQARADAAGRHVTVNGSASGRPSGSHPTT